MLELERAVFVTRTHGWDTHATFDLGPLFREEDDGLKSLVTELKAQGVWEVFCMRVPMCVMAGRCAADGGSCVEAINAAVGRRL